MVMMWMAPPVALRPGSLPAALEHLDALDVDEGRLAPAPRAAYTPST
ncbi:MAG: hypothetical protein IPF57_24715 [Gammaproteobacteria bacterium]|nr:hypothetical protein [Gammaproteobacteria bacterium]